MSDSTRVATAVNEAAGLFRTVFLEASEGMLLVGPARQILEANPAACLLFGLGPDELARRRLDELLGKTDGDLDEVWSALVATGKASGTHRIARRGDDLRVIECRYRTAVEAQRYLCIARDTTERRRLEERLVHAEKNDSLGRLAGGIAHDFNNLLTAILGYTTLLLDERSAGAVDRPDLEQIQQAAQRAAALAQQLLAYSRKQTLARREVDLNQAVTSLHAMLVRLIREDISLVCEPCHVAAVARIDPTQLQQVIINLVLNARDAIPAEGTIRVGVTLVPASRLEMPTSVQSRAAEYVELTVSDDGVGLLPEAHAQVVGPFFARKNDSWPAIGPGLASVYEIVRQSHGFIAVDSELGRGTTFEIYFPAVDPTGANQPQTPRPASPPTTARETILLVEDEAAVREIASTILSRNGYRVLQASTPREAWELFEVHPDAIDLLLTDVVMPELNGPGLAQRLVAVRPKLRVLFMSGYADVESPFVVGNPSVSCLAKPFQAAALLEKVSAILGQMS